MLQKLWVEKYRPKKLSDCVFSNTSDRNFFANIINSKNLPHLLLTGSPGTGKTTVAKILINELGLDPSDVLTINASDENSVDVIREKIKAFITTASFDSDYKIVHLSEADYISIPGQAILRTLLEEEYADSCRFIFTCNYPKKIIPAIRSRCQQITFNEKQSNEAVLARLSFILKSESIEFDPDTLKAFSDRYSPDLRKTINELQSHSRDSTLESPHVEDDTSNAYFEAVLQLIIEGDWITCRDLAFSNMNPDDWSPLYKFIYQNIHTAGNFEKESSKLEEAYILLAEHVYKHAVVADPEINGMALIIQLIQAHKG